MEPNEILVDRVDDIALWDISELKVSNNGEHEVDQNQKRSNIYQRWNRKLNCLQDGLQTWILTSKFQDSGDS
jgi:hypothetical protein